MYAPSDPTQYDACAGTVAGWGRRPRTLNAADVEGFRRRVAEAQKRGIRYCASVDFLVDFSGFIDFRPDNFMDAACRDLDGNPIHVLPWKGLTQLPDAISFWTRPARSVTIEPT